ncbi:MAG: hypothetical protein K2L18_10805, partial [Acetatifactor sp.]|nr:hypothetical protein [Acetatifactor sp.]
TAVSDASPSEGWESVTSGDHFSSSDDTPEQEPPNDEPVESGMAVPGEAPMFSAYIEYSPQGYLARGTFTEFLPGTSLISPLYSLDGEVWQSCQTTWNLQWLDSETADDLKHLQNQTCLYSTHEPLASYLAGQLDRFYLKLQITLENGITYETRAAVIDRGDPQPIPEEFHPVASFVSDMLIRQWIPFMRYGRYQITVSADATPEDISALLPDTLPIEIQLYNGINFAANVIVDCPVTWKPLSLSELTADESVTIADAAEEIIVPAGTLLNTPCGIFQLNEPLGIDNDEIRLVLNVVSENAVPTGVLAYDLNGLQIAFRLKPTGATAIRAYTLSEDESDWVELPNPLLPEEINAPSSTAGSAYTFLLRNTSEPYQTYLTAWNAGDEPAPFLVGLKIEGGVYDGRELILAWPDTYELPAKLPSLSGSGGNECNAGSDNKDDSTLDGQRPGLPQDPENRPDAQEPDPPQDSKDGQEAKEPETPQNPKDGQDTAEPETPQNPKDEQGATEPESPQNLKDKQDTQEPETPQDSKGEQDTMEPETPQDSKGEQDTREPETPQSPGDERDIQGLEVSQSPKYK